MENAGWAVIATCHEQAIKRNLLFEQSQVLTFKNASASRVFYTRKNCIFERRDTSQQAGRLERKRIGFEDN